LSAVADLDSGVRHDGGIPNGKGVNGTVVFNIADGSYNTSFVLKGVQGSSATNTITFQSASHDSSKVILNTGNNVDTSIHYKYVAILDSVSYVTFSEISFASTVTYTQLMNVTPKSSYITVHNCYFNNYGGATFWSNANNTTLKNNYLLTHYMGDNVVVTPLNMSGGPYALFSIDIEGNTLVSDSGSVGLWVTDISGLTIKNNIITGKVQFGVYLFNCTNVYEISGNIINARDYGMSIQYAYNVPRKPGQVFNNAVTATYSIVLDYYDHFNFYNNSIFSKNGTALSINNEKSLFTLNIINNCMVALKGPIISMSNDQAINVMNHNNYYSDSALISYTKLYTKLSDWQNDYFFDSSSISVDPEYAGATDLHPSNSALKAGQPLALVSTDIEGKARNTSKPTIGAYELGDSINILKFTARSLCFGNTSSFEDLSSVSNACGTITGRTWKFGDGATDNHNPSDHKYAKAGIYTVWLVISTSNGCKDSTYKNIYIDSTCVWPGDANNDKIANISDILNIGLAYSDTGSSRDSSISRTSWVGQSCQNWSKSFKSGLNHKYADCDGDGKVDRNDVVTLGYNYGFTHPKTNTTEQATALDPSLFIKFNSDSVSAGDTVKAKIYLGTSAQPADKVYGMVFTLSYDPKYVDSGSAVINFNNCWVGKPGTDIITLTHDAYNSGQMYVGLSRINQASVKGYGEIGELSIVMQDNVAGKDWIHRKVKLDISGVKMIDEQENVMSLNTVGDSMEVYQETALKQTKASDDRIVLYPNPAAQELFINTALEVKTVRIYDMTGKLMSTQLTTGKSPYKIETASLSQGAYTIRIESSTGTASRLFIRQ
jgi:hypothetical protein